jgi:hypothetical protein
VTTLADKGRSASSGRRRVSSMQTPRTSRVCRVLVKDLAELLRAAGGRDIHETSLSVDVEHTSFKAWWDPFLLGVGPAGKYVANLQPTKQARLRDLCRERLPRAPFVVSARAWAARGLA